MGEIDPSKTQRFEVTAELEDVGFGDALEIGRGGFGAVFRCTQIELNRVVAVKILTADFEGENRERFVREQQAMGRLTGHPNIVAVLQIGTTNTGRPYLVMPYYSRGSLDTRIRDQGPLTMEETLRLGVKTAGALESAHRAAILHRDVKPGNILFTDYGEPVLTDFGIARLAGGFETTEGSVAGSPSFTAPEVLGGHPPSSASDVYGLGATLFAALTGHAAFERHSGEQLVAQFLRITTAPVPGLQVGEYGKDLSAVVEQAMSRDPSERPSPAALGDTLRDIQASRGFPVDEMALSEKPAVGSAEARRESRVSPGSSYRVVGRAVATARGGLPLQLTSFVGRRSELVETKRLLSKSRLVTLTGIGGVGKTRLALQVATGVRRDFPDGVCLVELGELRDGALLPGVIAAALGLSPQGRPALELLTEALASKKLILVLDNCEQIVDATARAAEVLLQTCLKIRILATSRECLGIGGEAVLRVPPLTVPDPNRRPDLQGAPAYESINLFVDRAAAAAPGFALTEDNTATVAQICHHLDGLPLAIELAAARLRVLSPEQILQRLTDQYALLTRGTRDAPYRQQALQSCIDWSYELCNSDEQRLWAQLSVFAGTFELDGAEYVCASACELDGMVDVLTSLVDKSILIREGAGTGVRFRLLETLRTYGQQKLEHFGEFATVGQRHRDWYRQLALDADAEWISSRQLEWIARLDRAQPNLREALEFCLANDGMGSEVGLSLATAMQPFWASHGQLGEGRYWLDRALSRPGAATAVRAKALYRNCTMAEGQGDRVAATNLFKQAKALAGESDDSVVHMFVEFTEGLIELYDGNSPRACSCLEAALGKCVEMNDISTQIRVTLALGLAYERSGNSECAMDYCKKALEMTETRGDSVYRSIASGAMALATWRGGDRDRAVLLLRQSVRLTRQQQDPIMAAAALETLAWVGYSDKTARQSAVLMGAAQMLGKAAGISSVTVPHLPNYHEKYEQAALRVLGPRAYKAAYREGTSLSLDAATSYALGEQPNAAESVTTPSTELTKREREVADLVAEGMTNRAIAGRLVISVRTAQGHVEHILTKLGFTSRAQIAAWVAEQRQH
ncbi:protein kinase [Rhodococcus sp. NPDC057014]|uniref:protein kinase domain-containing protein n=1 Tax=Rhodococcus sp. NPDC057014 TaxID=3346000 RepID=UPI003639FDCA